MKAGKDETKTTAGQVMLRAVVIVFLFCALGPMARLLLLGTWYGVPVWPSAGAMLVALLLWGRGYWPAVFLGAALTAWVCLDRLDDAETRAQLLVVAMGAGTAASLQVLLSAWLVQRWGHFGRSFEHIRELSYPVVLASLPVLLGSALGSASIALSGIMSWADVPLLMLYWALAEALGILFVLPLVSIWRSELATANFHTKLAVALPPALVLFSFIGIFAFSLEKRQFDLADAFTHRAEHIAESFERVLERHVQALDVMDAFMRASEEVTPEEFASFVAAVREAGALQCAMAWVPRVPQAKRETFLAEAREAGFTDYAIFVETEEDTAESATGAPNSARHFPIYYIEPRDKWQATAGLDLGSDPKMLAAMLRARDSGEIALAPPESTLESDLLGRGSILIRAHYAAMSERDTVEARRGALQGFNLCVLDIHGAMEAAMQGSHAAHLSAYLYGAELPDRIHIHSNNPGPGADSVLPDTVFRGLGRYAALDFACPIKLADKDWRIRVVAKEAYYTANLTQTAESMILGGVLIACLLAAVLMVLAGRNARAELLVRQRTAALHGEIDERIAAEEKRILVIRELQDALAAIRTLEGLLPICSACKKVRDDKGYWTQIEAYVARHSRAEFSHGICPDCLKALYPEFAVEESALPESPGTAGDPFRPLLSECAAKVRPMRCR